MAILVSLIKFIFTAIGLTSLGLFVLAIISNINNPNFVMKEGKLTNETNNAVYMLLFISAIAFGIVISLF